MSKTEGLRMQHGGSGLRMQHGGSLLTKKPFFVVQHTAKAVHPTNAKHLADAVRTVSKRKLFRGKLSIDLKQDIGVRKMESFAEEKRT